MAAQNFSGDGQLKTVGDLTCLFYLTSGLHGDLIFPSVLNSFLSVTAFLGNSLIFKKVTTCFNFEDMFRCCQHHRQLQNI